MSRTIKGSKGVGYDFWSRRPCSKNGYGPIVKDMTKRRERMEEKKIVRNEVKNYDS